jgi:hypothetical protein
MKNVGIIGIFLFVTFGAFCSKVIVIYKSALLRQGIRPAPVGPFGAVVNVAALRLH